MKSFRRVAIIGTGLIGGSVGLALRRRNVVRIGFDRPAVLSKALKMGAIDRRTKNLKEAADDSDLIILAMPVGEILDLLPKLAQVVQSATLITDVGSSKGKICKLAARDLKNFIGGHPLAGKEKSGIENAEGNLFAGKSWFLCPNGNSIALARMMGFVRLLGARPVVVEPGRHDRVLAATSHLPQLVSSLLAATIGELLGENGSQVKSYAGAGLKDTVRLAGSPFSVWKDIFATNHLEIERALSRFAGKVNRISSAVSNSGILERQFEKANTFMGKLE